MANGILVRQGRVCFFRALEDPAVDVLICVLVDGVAEAGVGVSENDALHI